MPRGTGRRRDLVAQGFSPASERGAILVHVAVAFVGLLAFSALTVDLGILWIARTEAQAAADAAALAASVSLAYGDPDDAAAPEAAARAIAAVHEVWGQRASAAGDVGFNPIECPPDAQVPDGPCVEIQVFRGAGGGTPLPTAFAGLFGVSTQQLRATAAAKVVVANSTNCLRPWAIADQWFENQAPAIEFNPGPGGDVYAPPDDTAPNSGYTRDQLYGAQLPLTPASLDDPVVGANLLFTLDLARADGAVGTTGYTLNVTSCTGLAITLGDYVITGPTGISTLITADAVDALLDLDPSADWDAGTGTVTGSAFPVSPRIVPIALFDPDELAVQGNPPSPAFNLRIRNIVGFFVEAWTGSELVGRVVPMPGSLVTDAGAHHVSDEASFLRNVMLVR